MTCRALQFGGQVEIYYCVLWHFRSPGEISKTSIQYWRLRSVWSSLFHEFCCKFFVSLSLLLIDELIQLSFSIHFMQPPCSQEDGNSLPVHVANDWLGCMLDLSSQLSLHLIQLTLLFLMQQILLATAHTIKSPFCSHLYPEPALNVQSKKLHHVCHHSVPY